MYKNLKTNEIVINNSIEKGENTMIVKTAKDIEPSFFTNKGAQVTNREDQGNTIVWSLGFATLAAKDSFLDDYYEDNTFVIMGA